MFRKMLRKIFWKILRKMLQKSSVEEKFRFEGKVRVNIKVGVNEKWEKKLVNIKEFPLSQIRWG